MEMKRRHFLGGMLATGVLPALGVPESGRIARIGLMTDTHVLTTLESCNRVKAALTLFKAKGAEMVINCGDIADNHYPEGYRFYRQTVNTVYPEAETRPREIFIYAWHDLINHEPYTGGKTDYVAAFENLRKEIQAPNPPFCDFVWKGLPFVVSTQCVGQKGFPTWDEYAKTIARVCAENPGKPVFVCDHVPPAGTTFHSRQWGNETLRDILNRFPQVVSLSGHVHGTLACERQIWQGQFTAINAGCLQTWGGFAPGSTPPPQAKPNFGALVLDVFPDRIVAYRYDVRDGSEFGPPWVVPLPFVAMNAPYCPGVAAQCQKRPAFADGTAVTVRPVGTPVSGYAITIPETTVGPASFMYRIRCQRKNADGEWESFTQDDIFGEFWKAKKDRTGQSHHTLATGFFTPGETYRVAVSPVDFFYRETPPAFGTFTATHEPPRLLWESDNPMDTQRFSEYGKTVERAPDGSFAPPSGQGTFWLPDNLFAKVEKGKRHQLVVDIDSDQPYGEWCAWRVALQGRNSPNRICEVQTVPGKPGTLRYVFAFTPPGNRPFPESCNLLFNYKSPHSALRIRHIRLICG